MDHGVQDQLRIACICRLCAESASVGSPAITCWLHGTMGTAPCSAIDYACLRPRIEFPTLRSLTKSPTKTFLYSPPKSFFFPLPDLGKKKGFEQHGGCAAAKAHGRLRMLHRPAAQTRAGNHYHWRPLRKPSDTRTRRYLITLCRSRTNL